VSTALDAAPGVVTVSVADTGSGIPAEVLPRVFDRFYKSADSGGSGLGLAIARHLVVAHDGEITAASEPGRGTTIHFTLPIAASA
jgi:signal transduction histidine kinase